MPKFDRRHFLKLSLGAGQLAMLGGAGLLTTSPAFANNSLRGASRLLTLYVPGGWMPVFFCSPLGPSQISEFIPGYKPYGNGNQGREPAFYDPQHVTNLDGSGDARGRSGYQRLRTTQFWDESATENGQYDAPGNLSLNGYAWKYFDLWKKTVAIHGVDQGTAAHESGRISALSGAAGANWRSPAIHAWVANALFARHGEQRVLGSIALGSAPLPGAYGIAHGSPTFMRDLEDLQVNFSEENALGWKGIGGIERADTLTHDLRGNMLATPIDTTRLERRTLERIQALHARPQHTHDAALLEQIWETYRSVSTQLSSDLVNTLENTVGWRALTDQERATRSRKFAHWQTRQGQDETWVSTGLTYLGEGNSWRNDFDLALRLLKSNLTSAISMRVSGPGDFDFDTHSGSGHEVQCVQNRAVFEAIGRLLGEMDTTPGIDDPTGKTLLDETLVVICSEFARTWPGGQKCDHHPATSVFMVGGGINETNIGNRMVGNYDTSKVSPSSLGPLGEDVELLDRQGNLTSRMPRSADVIHTALNLMGIEEFDIVGGSGLIKGADLWS